MCIFLLCYKLLTDYHNPVMSKVFELLESFHLGRCVECSGVLPITLFAYRKGMGILLKHFLCMSHILHCALESGQGARIVQIFFRAAIDRVNHQRILRKLYFMGIGVMCNPYWHGLSQIDYTTLRLTFVDENWSTLCQECSVFSARFVPLGLLTAQVERHSKFPLDDLIFQYIQFYAKDGFKKCCSSEGF